MDLELVKKEFDKYVSNYDMKDSNINLKYYHSYKVMDLMKELADKLNLNDEEIVVAQVIGLLHDIGRFEQIKKYNIIYDYGTCDHADESVIYLFDKGHIRDFIKEDKYDEIIKKAIKNHNKKFIDENINDNTELLFSKLIRDADKIDIYRTYAVNYDLTFSAEEASSDALLNINNGELVDISLMNNDSNNILAAMALLFDFNFDESYDLLVETDNFDLFLGSIKVQENSEKLWKKLREICFDKINKGV